MKQYQKDIGSLVVEVSPVNGVAVADDVGMPKVNKLRGLIRKSSPAEVDGLKSTTLQKSYNRPRNITSTKSCASFMPLPSCVLSATQTC